MWTAAQASSTLITASPVSAARRFGAAWPAATRTNPTATRLTTLAATTSSSAARRESSRAAIPCVSAASILTIVRPTHARNTVAAASQPTSTATDQVAPAARATAATAAPSSVATAARTSARPARETGALNGGVTISAGCAPRG